MNTLLFPALLAAALGLGFAWCPPAADELPRAPSPQDLLLAGPQHALLQKYAGTWDAVLISRDATGAEQRTQGVRRATKLAGYHVLEDFQGTFMGLPFLGHGIGGYCNVRRKYFSLWADSMTPTPVTFYGDYDEKRRELSLSGECFGMSGGLEPCRAVTRFVDDDHFTWTFYGRGPDGKELQHLRIEYARAR